MIPSGETLRFPVPSGHPLAKYQSFKRLSEISNLQDLAIVKSIVQRNPAVSSKQIHEALTQYLSTGNNRIHVLDIPGDLTVPTGTTLIFPGPVTMLTLRNVDIQGTGTILAYGSFNLLCRSIGDSTYPLYPPGSGPGLPSPVGPPLSPPGHYIPVQPEG